MTPKTDDNITNRLQIPNPRINEAEPIDLPGLPEPTINPIRPAADWSLEQLGKFARTSARKSAESAWELGRALSLAKSKAKRKYGEWRAKYVPFLSERTEQRYRTVGALDYDDVRGKTLDELYRILYGEDYAVKKPTQTLDAVPTPPEPASGDEPEPINETEPGEQPATVGTVVETENETVKEGDKTERFLTVVEFVTEIASHPDEWVSEIRVHKEELTRLRDALNAMLDAI